MPDAATESDLLAAFLAGADVPCPACGYNLRGLGGAAAGDRCPECEQALELRLEPAEPRLGSFIAGLVGLAAGVGFPLAFITLALLLVLSGASSWENMAPEIWPLPLNAVLNSALLVAWVRGRHRLRRLSRSLRLALAAACWVLTAGLAALFFLRAM